MNMEKGVMPARRGASVIREVVSYVMRMPIELSSDFHVFVRNFTSSIKEFVFALNRTIWISLLVIANV